jgi:iron complex outermembrane receptor protein
LFLCTVSTFAQVIIRGTITDDKKNPLGSVSVRLGKHNTFSDSTGNYSFADIKTGTYPLVFSHIGFETFTDKVTLLAGEPVKVMDIILLSTSKELQGVEITGRKETGYKNSVTFSGTKTATDIKDIPQSIQYVTKEVMQDQGAVRMTDIVKNVSGVNQHTFYDDVTIRGFRNQGGVGSNSSTQLFNGL